MIIIGDGSGGGEELSILVNIVKQKKKKRWFKR